MGRVRGPGEGVRKVNRYPFWPVLALAWLAGIPLGMGAALRWGERWYGPEATRDVVIESTPPGARIQIDGREVRTVEGTLVVTPARAHGIPAHVVRVELTKHGHFIASRHLQPREVWMAVDLRPYE